MDSKREAKESVWWAWLDDDDDDDDDDDEVLYKIMLIKVFSVRKKSHYLFTIPVYFYGSTSEYSELINDINILTHFYTKISQQNSV